MTVISIIFDPSSDKKLGAYELGYWDAFTDGGVRDADTYGLTKEAEIVDYNAGKEDGTSDKRSGVFSNLGDSDYV